MTKWMRWKKWLALTLSLEFGDARERRAIAVGAACALAHVILASVMREVCEPEAAAVAWLVVFLVDLPFSVLACALYFVLDGLGLWLHILGARLPSRWVEGSLDFELLLFLSVSGTIWWFYLGLWFGRLFHRGK